MSNLAFDTIKELTAKLKKKKCTSQDILQTTLDRFSKYNKTLGTALEVFDAESIVEKSYSGGPLEGIPGLLKDNISQESRELTCGSNILTGFHAMYDATVTRSLKSAGAYIVGRANMDEFAMGSSTETSAFFPAKNPWDVARVPGGSSGGSAVAVAAGLVPWALGSDTGGSVRQPAAFCGIVGMKPTYGLVSRYGLVAYGSSLDQIGVFTRSVYDNALVLSTIAGHDLKDSSSLYVSKKDYTNKLTEKLPENLTIGVIDDALYAPGMDTEIVTALEESIRVFEQLGATIRRVSLPSLNYVTAAYFIIRRAEAASNLARFDGVRYGLRNKEAKILADMYATTRHDGFGQEVKTRIMVGNYVLSAGHAGDFYTNAKMVQRLIRREFLDTFKSIDVLLMPTHPVPAFPFGAYDIDKLQMDLQDYFTCSANLAGIPGISIPCGFTKNLLPIGFQLLGPHLSEGLLYQVAHAYEQATPWHTYHPKQFV
jgi:aspartyl-tRNA(Asn)/glutamyl-tRNA(Gln) amidotransferase subunit A